MENTFIFTAGIANANLLWTEVTAINPLYFPDKNHKISINLKSKVPIKF
jgi:hypothetical protein